MDDDHDLLNLSHPAQKIITYFKKIEFNSSLIRGKTDLLTKLLETGIGQGHHQLLM